MHTSVSLLEALRQPENDEAWSELYTLYSPLIAGWLNRLGIAGNDVDDVVQEVLAVVVRRYPEFRKKPHVGSFRAWLRTIAVNCVRDHWRRQNRQPRAVGGTDFVQQMQQLQDEQSELSQLWNREHDQHVLMYLVKRIRTAVTESTWQAFQKFALEGRSADEVAAELGITSNAVFIAKSRVMTKLRTLGRGLIEEI